MTIVRDFTRVISFALILCGYDGNFQILYMFIASVSGGGLSDGRCCAEMGSPRKPVCLGNTDC